MADDALIAGAAAPAGTRLIRSASVLDSVWAAVVASALFASSFYPLIDLPGSYLRTVDAPLRVYVVLVPVVAFVVAFVALIRRSVLLAAVATGVLVPGVALCGSLGGALFFDAASPFTDAGVPLAVGAAVIGVVMLIRWFVYHPAPLLGVEPRPTSRSSRVLLGVGLVLVVNVTVKALRDDPAWSLSFVVATAFMLLGPAVVVAAAAARAIAAFAVAAAACFAQIVAVLIARFDDGQIDIDGVLALRTGVVGLIVSAIAAAVAIGGAVMAEIEPDEGEGASDDDADWRWSVDDDLGS
jgi:hypothetical protein